MTMPCLDWGWLKDINIPNDIYYLLYIIKLN